MTAECHQLFGRDLNTVLHELMHHAQLGGRVLLHNKVKIFFGRDFEKLRNYSSGPDSELVGTHPPHLKTETTTPQYALKRESLHIVYDTVALLAMYLLHCTSCILALCLLH